MNKNLQSYYGIYRGTVLDNSGPKGLCKVFVRGLYPSEFENDASSLPWCEPALGIFGGNYTNSNSGDLNGQATINSTPHIGAEVFVFFENGDHLKPILFASSNGGSAWKSEHKDQHILQTNNVKITIDDNPSDPKSTMQFDSYNKNCTENSKIRIQEPTIVSVEAQGNVHLKVYGSVNLQVHGDCSEEIIGNKHSTIIGNFYQTIKGNVEIDHFGNSRTFQKGNSIDIQLGNQTETRIGTLSGLSVGNENLKLVGNREEIVGGTLTETINGNKTMFVNNGSENRFIGNGSKSEQIFGNNKLVVGANQNIEVVGDNTINVGGNMLHYINNSISYAVNKTCTSLIKGSYNLTSEQNIKVVGTRIDLN